MMDYTSAINTRGLTMISIKVPLFLLLLPFISLALTSCASYTSRDRAYTPPAPKAESTRLDYADRLPQHMNTGGGKMILIDPNVHAWGAYDSSGKLIRAGLATAGASYCPDIGRGCKTTPGSFRIYTLGGPECKSTRYPRPRGGAPMPYCMFFNKHQGLHGSPYVMEGNASHGCVRMRVADAEWVRYQFATIGTRVVVRAY
jgi:hypothetical protein